MRLHKVKPSPHPRFFVVNPGLTLCKRIIEQYHKGELFVKHSEPGKGTTFRIVLKK